MKLSSLTLTALLLLPLSGVHLTSITPAVVAQRSNKEIDTTQLRNIARSITVKITSGDNAGSGVIIKQQGNTYTVITNRHTLKPGKTTRIQTPDTLFHDATVLAVDFEDKDVVLLQFRSATQYTVARLGNLATVGEGDSVLAAGFPYDTDELFFTTGELSIIRSVALPRGYQLGYDNAIEKGMSGGPILTKDGMVIGINGLLADAPFGNPYLNSEGSGLTDATRDLLTEV